MSCYTSSSINPDGIHSATKGGSFRASFGSGSFEELALKKTGWVDSRVRSEIFTKELKTWNETRMGRKIVELANVWYRLLFEARDVSFFSIKGEKYVESLPTYDMEDEEAPRLHWKSAWNRSGR